jgi:transcriptional regulator with XRE-family HTH domain
MATNDKMKRLFSQRLVGVMQENNINQVELSKILGVSESTVGKWILCKAIPRMGVIQKLSDYFHVGKSYFLEEDANTGYYTDPTVNEYAEQLRTNPKMRLLFDATKDMTKEDIDYVVDLVNRLKGKE